MLVELKNEGFYFIYYKTKPLIFQLNFPQGPKQL